MQAYTIAKESERIILDELAGVSGHASQQDESDEGTIELTARAKLRRREAVAQVSLEGEAILELVIQLPESWPLNSAKLDCRKGVSLFTKIQILFVHRDASPAMALLVVW